MKTQNIFLVFIFFLVLWGNQPLWAQNNGVVKGRVFDAINNEPLPFVNVVVVGTTTGTVTDLDGNFTITGLEPGFIRLSVSFVGYQTAVSDEIQVSNAKTAYVELPLQESEQKLEEVVVRASPFRKTEESPVSLRSIGLSDIESNPGSNRDISKVIASFPGVGTTPLFRNDIIIRGGGPSESTFYLDGIEIPTINHFATQGSSGGAVGIINADFISSVNYYAGAFPANRSDALSGVFEFTQKDGNKDKLRFRGTVGASELSLTADGPIGERSTFIVSGRQSYLQFLFSALGLPFLPTFNDFQLKSRTRIDDKNELTIVGLGAIDRFSLNTDLENPTEEQQYILNSVPVNEQWNYAIGAVYKHFSENSYQTFVLSRNMLNNSSYKYPNNDQTQPKTLDYLSQEMENKFRFESTNRFNGYKLVYGANLQYAKYNNDTQQQLFAGGELRQIDYYSEFDMFKWGVFGQLSKGFLNEKLTLSLGLRTDANNYSESMSNMLEQISPRFSVSYDFNETFSINANTGRYYQLPAYTTLGYRETDGTLVNKQNDLKYVYSDHVIAGFEIRPKQYIKFSVEGFYKKYGNYPFSVQDNINLANKGVDFSGAVGAEEVVSTGEGRALGFETLARWSKKDFNMILSYTFVRSEFQDEQGQYTPSAWDSKHILTLTAVRNIGKNWTIGAKWRFLGGLPYTPYDIENSAYIDVWNSKGSPYFDYTRLNAERLDPFHQLDIRIDKKFFFERWSLMLYVDVQNLYNFQATQPANYILQRNPDGSPAIDPENDQKYLLKRLENTTGTVLPTIGIMVEF